ncbi:hypothetical protein PoB_004486800 [Plakobranchus ocellatus]|uniref:Uncharacterized protein n=1 Tax=Plakobranchus ocellatus TaxID=259542 RepID=A0AAV4BGT4_9GAST|nr:hypothetical protein PoB_004486800 [Plakobranchus ocellatus]
MISDFQVLHQASGAVRTSDRWAPAYLRADSLSTVPPAPPTGLLCNPFYERLSGAAKLCFKGKKERKGGEERDHNEDVGGNCDVVNGGDDDADDNDDDVDDDDDNDDDDDDNDGHDDDDDERDDDDDNDNDNGGGGGGGSGDDDDDDDSGGGDGHDDNDDYDNRLGHFHHLILPRWCLLIRVDDDDDGNEFKRQLSIKIIKLSKFLSLTRNLKNTKVSTEQRNQRFSKDQNLTIIRLVSLLLRTTGAHMDFGTADFSTGHLHAWVNTAAVELPSFDLVIQLITINFGSRGCSPPNNYPSVNNYKLPNNYPRVNDDERLKPLAKA